MPCGGLFIDADVADKLGPLLGGRADLVRGATALAQATEVPSKHVGAHCSDPYDCPFTSYCHEALPAGPAYPVTLLPNRAGKQAAAALIVAGYQDLRDVPAEQLAQPQHRRMHAATMSGKPFHDAAGFSAAIANWTFPRYFLDFETISHAIPPWAGTRPYQQIPFQYSCRIEAAAGGLDHKAFLDLTGTDPSRACAEALVADIGEIGAIITYNVSFERSCIEALAARFADLRGPLLLRAARLVDLLPLVQTHYYHRDMRGSFSIKAVLPAAVPALSYKDLEGVQDGQTAQAAYRVAIAAGVSPEAQAALHEQLKRAHERVASIRRVDFNQGVDARILAKDPMYLRELSSIVTAVQAKVGPGLQHLALMDIQESPPQPRRERPCETGSELFWSCRSINITAPPRHIERQGDVCVVGLPLMVVEKPTDSRIGAI
jgi:hypothetical protein